MKTLYFFALSAFISSHAHGIGNLNWGKDPVTHQAWTASDLKAALRTPEPGQPGHALRRVITRSQETFSEKIVPIPEIQSEGVLFSDPRYIATQAAVKPLRNLLSW